MERLPLALFEDCSDDDERAARIGRFLVLREMGFFGDKTNLALAIESHPPGTFMGSLRRKVSNVYGGVEGCSRGDIEVTMDYLGVYDDIMDYELRKAKK